MISKKSYALGFVSCLAVMASAWVVVGLAGCGSNSVDSGDVAVVDGEPITMEQFHKYLETKAQVDVTDQQGRTVTANVAGTLGYQGMFDLIKQATIRHLAKDEGVYPTDAEVGAELEYQKKRNPNFLKLAQQEGLGTEQIRGQLQLSLAAERLVTKGITITKDDVDKYIKDNPDQFKEPETADLDWVVVGSDDEKKQVDSDLLAGQRFAAVAQRYSRADNARAYQGRYPVRILSQMPPQLQELIKKTPEYKATDWIKQGGLSYKWFVEKKTPAKDIPIDDTIREGVRRSLAIQRGSQATDLNKRILDKLKSSKIDIKVTAYKPMWESAMDNLESQTKSTGAGASAPPSAPAAGK